MDDQVFFDTDTDTDRRPQSASLSGLLDTLERLKGEFDQRLTGIVRTETDSEAPERGLVDQNALDLLRPFTEAMRSMGRSLDGDPVGPAAEPARRAPRKKRFLTDGVDVALGDFQGPVAVRVYLAPRRPSPPNEERA